MSLTAGEIRRELRRFIYDPYYKEPSRRVPIVPLCRYCGIAPQTAREIINGVKDAGPKCLSRFGPVIEKIMAGQIYFVRVGFKWEVCERPASDYAGAGKTGSDRAAKIIPLPKPQLLNRI